MNEEVIVIDGKHVSIGVAGISREDEAKFCDTERGGQAVT